MEVIQTDKRFDDASVVKLLMHLITNNVKEVQTHTSHNSQSCYNEFEKVLGLSKDGCEKILEYMRSKNYLTKQCSESILICPQCRNNQVLSLIQCPKCYFSGIEKNIAGKVSYACKRCGEVFHEQKLKMHCINCDAKFDVEEMMLKDVYSYTINDKTEEKIRSLLRPLQVIKELLTEKGFSTELFARVKGESDITHCLDMFASKKIGDKEARIVANLLVDQDPIAPSHVLGAYAQALDVDANENIIIAVPELSDESRRFANFYRIRTFEARDTDNALESLAVWLYALSDEASWLK